MEKRIFSKKRIFGKRVLKTALVASISLYISSLIFGETLGFAGFSAIVTMATNLPETVNISIKRMFATIIASIFSIFFHLTGLVNPISIFIGIIAIILICNHFKWQGAIELSLLFFVAIMCFNGPKYEIVNYSLIRLSDTAIGLIVGLIVNLFIAKPRLENFLYREYLKLYNNILIEFKHVIEGKDVNSEDLISSIAEIVRLYGLFKRERKLKFTKRNDKLTISKINDKLSRIATNVIDLSYYKNIPITHGNRHRLEDEYNIHDFYEENPNIHGDDIIFFNFELDKVMNAIDSLSEDLITMKKELKHYEGIIEESIEDIEKEENVKIGEFEKDEDEKEIL